MQRVSASHAGVFLEYLVFLCVMLLNLSWSGCGRPLWGLAVWVAHLTKPGWVFSVE